MGRPMASNLLKAGYSLVVNDLFPAAASKHLEAGAIWADTPKALADQCDVMFTCLPGLLQIEDVTLGSQGLFEGMRPGQALFEMSTSTPEQVSRLHQTLAAIEVHMLDAPISGGPNGAMHARLAIWVGGDLAVYQRYESILRVMGDKTVHVGAIGAGLVTKLVHNCASQATQAAIAEAFVLGVKAGADPLSLWKALRHGGIGGRRTFDGLSDQFLLGQYDTPQAALSIVYKDVKSATELARELRIPMRIANLAFADLQEAMNRGWSERDCRSVMLLPQERAGVEIRVEQAAIDQVLKDDPRASSDVNR